MTGDAPAEAERVTVRLLGLPLRMHARAQQHTEGMRREFALIVAQAHEHGGSVPARLLGLSTLLSQRYEGFTSEQELAVEEATAAGLPRLDELRFELPSHAGGAAAEFGRMLDEADAYCRAGQLLMLATPPDLVLYRRWYLDNFISQCAGGAPTPWRGPLA